MYESLRLQLHKTRQCGTLCGTYCRYDSTYFYSREYSRVDTTTTHKGALHLPTVYCTVVVPPPSGAIAEIIF